jgi:hypothetical protein
VSTYKGVAIHGDSDFPSTIRTGIPASQHFSQAPDTHWRIAAGEGNHIFDTTAHIHSAGREETDATGTDITGFLRAIHGHISDLQNLQGKLQFVSL